MSTNIVAVDFGTVNTYITIGVEGDRASFQPMYFDGNIPQFSTVLLYSDSAAADSSVFPIIGNMAEETYGAADSKEIEQKGYRYRSVFKPNIADSDDARQCAIDFLRAVIRDARKKSLPLNLANSRVIFGVPCEASHKWRNTLVDCAKQAGFGDVETLEEPKGALVCDLSGSSFDLSAILQGHLVIDFGGGTCDFTYFRNSEIKHSWGDMYLGGRLLDDVFYQWFTDQYPDVAADVERSGDTFFTLTLSCRDIKEWFSNTINSDSSWSGKRKLVLPGDLPSCILRDLCRDEFQRRAENYTPSKAFCDIIEKLGQSLPDNFKDRSTNLLHWLWQCLNDGLKAKGLTFKDIHAVSLAGGSSSWYFVREYCQNFILGGDAGNMLQSPRPFAAVSEGLAAYSTVKQILREKRESLKNEAVDFVSKEIVPFIHVEIDAWLNDTVNNLIMLDIFDKIITPVLHDFRENGGTLNDLRQRIVNAVDSEQTTFLRQLSSSANFFVQGFADTITVKLHNWLIAAGVKRSQFISTRAVTVGASTASDVDPLNNIVEILNYIFTAVTVIIVANVCGGTGVALIIAGPLGLIAGALLGLVAAGLAILYGQDTVKEWIEQNVAIPAVICKNFILSDKAIKKLRADTVSKMKAKLKEEIYPGIADATQALLKAVDQELDQLNTLDVL